MRRIVTPPPPTGIPLRVILRYLIPAEPFAAFLQWPRAVVRKPCKRRQSRPSQSSAGRQGAERQNPSIE
jgi:hypothetical protein